MKKIKSVYLGVNVETMKIWDREDGILSSEYFVQVIQQLEDIVAAFEELNKIIREEK